MSKSDSKKKGSKIVLIILLVILTLLAGVQIFFSFYLDSYVKNQLKTAVNEQTNGQYELKVDDLDLSVWAQTFEMDNMRLHPSDTASTAPKINIEQFSVNRIQFLPYLLSGDINVGRVQLSEPIVNIVQNSTDSLTFLRSSGTSSSRQKPPSIEVNRFLIEDGEMKYWKSNQDEERGELNNFTLEVSDIRFDTTSWSKVPYFNFSDLQTRSGKIHYELNNGLYTIETSGIDFSTETNFSSVDSLRLIPKYPRYEFYQTVGHQIDRFDLTLEQLLFKNPDIEKLKEGEFQLEKLIIQNADLDVFRSKELPRASKQPKKMAHMVFKDLNYPVTIDTIAVNQTNISYTEQLAKVTEPGSVTFTNLDGTFTDVTNDSAAISQGHTIKLDVTTEVMDEAPLEAHFEFPMHKNGSHTAWGSLGSMEAGQLNQILVPVGLVRAENGTIHSLQFEMDLGPQTSSGWVQLAYSDLRIEVLDAENVEGGGRQFFKSVLANLLKVKNSNTEEPLRKGEVSFERVEYKAIFNYWWKSLSSGLKKSIGM